jgi:hypothetical protein
LAGPLNEFAAVVVDAKLVRTGVYDEVAFGDPSETGNAVQRRGSFVITEDDLRLSIHRPERNIT